MEVVPGRVATLGDLPYDPQGAVRSLDEPEVRVAECVLAELTPCAGKFGARCLTALGIEGESNNVEHVRRLAAPRFMIDCSFIAMSAPGRAANVWNLGTQIRSKNNTACCLDRPGVAEDVKAIREV